jgi:prepilin-type N-terminal cleavage/methylation domain-containing protein
MIHKFKGFTLIEVLVVFVLSSFVVALIMYVYLVNYSVLQYD